MEMLAMPLATIIRYPASRYPIYIYIHVNTRGLLCNRDVYPANNVYSYN